MSLNNLVKRLQDIMRNDAGINGDAQRIEQMVWILFLKVYDAKEEIWEFYDENYTSIIPEELRWRNWAVDHKDGKALTFKCAECGTVATVYKTEDAAWAAGVNTVEVLKNGDIIGFNYTVPGAGGSGSSSGTKPSPKTFDAGIALYAAMALTSVAGSAVVIGKKKEF